MLFRSRIADRDAQGHPITDDTFLLLFNAGDATVSFTLPGAPAGSPRIWEVMPEFFESLPLPDFAPEEAAPLKAHRMAVLQARR